MTRTRSMPGTQRVIALAAMAALLLVLVPALPATADHTFNRGIADACPAETRSHFDDTEGHTHATAIDCASFWEIVRGYPDGTFRPNVNLNRGQMATVIVNMMETAGYEFNDEPPDRFDDTDGNPHKTNINKLADAGVVSGTGEREYSPQQPVRRGAMATFIRNALEEVTGEEIQPDEDDGDENGDNGDNGDEENGDEENGENGAYFDDTDGHTHERAINALASIGVVQGTGHRTYSPNGILQRGATTSFVMRGGDFLAEEGHWPDPASLGQSYLVEPSGGATMTAAAIREYTVEAPEGTAVNIRLFPAADIVFTPGVGTSFRDVASPSGVADHNESAARIIAVGGTRLATPVQMVSTSAPTGGELTFAVQSPSGALVVPVVWSDTPGGTQTQGRLDLDEDGRPTEPFGTGGAVTVIVNEAPDGASTPQVQGFDLANRMIAGTNARTYQWSAADSFRLQGASITQSDFEQRISVGDTLDVSYSRTGASIFDITSDVTHTPPAPSARAVEGPTDEGEANYVEVRFTLPYTNNPSTSYTLQRQSVAQPLHPPGSPCAQAGSPSGGGWETAAEPVYYQTVHVDGPHDEDCLVYRVVATPPVSGSAQASGPSGQVATGGDVDTTQPRITDSRATNDADPQGTVSSGDVHRFQFNENMDGAIADGWYRVSDPNGTIAEIVCEGNEEKTPNADCSYSNASSSIITGDTPATLTVTLTSAPHIVQAGGQPGVQYPATLVALSDEWRDQAGNKATFEGSDRVINVQ